MVPLAIGAVAGLSKGLIEASNEDKQADDASNVQGVASAVNGSAEQSKQIAQPQVSGSEAGNYGKQAFDAAFTKGVDSVVNPQMNAKDAGKYQRDYLASAFPEMNPWERAGAAATQAGVQAGQQQNQKQMLSMQLSNQKEIAQINANTQKEIAGIQSVTSRQNTKDQVYAQNTKLDAELNKLGAEATNIMQQTNLSTTQQSKMMVEMVTEQLKQQGIRLTNEQIPLLNKKIQAEIEKLKYGKSSLGATTNDVGNVLRDAVSQVVPEAKKLWNWTKQRFDMFLNGEGVQSQLR